MFPVAHSSSNGFSCGCSTKRGIGGSNSTTGGLSTGTPDDADRVMDDAQAAVDAALRRAAAYRGLEPVQLAVRVLSRRPDVADGPALAYTVEAADCDGGLGEVDLIIGFAYPREDEIEWCLGLDVSVAGDGSPPQIPSPDPALYSSRPARAVSRTLMVAIAR